MKLAWKFIIVIVIIMSAQYTMASDLLSLYKKALTNNHEFHAKVYQENIARDEKDLALSYLIPHFQVSAAFGRNRNNVTLKQQFIYIPLLPTQFDSKSSVYDVNLGMIAIIFDLYGLDKYIAAKVLVKAEHYKIEAERQTLFYNLLNNYLAILKSKNQLKYNSSELKFYRRQRKQIQDNLIQKNSTPLQLNEVQSMLLLTVTQRYNLKNEARESILDIFTKSGNHIDYIEDFRHIPVHEPNPDHVYDWIKRVQKNNPLLLSARTKLIALHKVLQAYTAKHLPVVFASASLNRIKTATPVFQVISGNSANVMLGLRFSIYSGGEISSEINKALHQYLQAIEEYQNALLNAKHTTIDIFGDIHTIINKLKADRQAIITARQTVSSAANAFKQGTTDVIDMLQAEKTFTQAEVNYQLDLINYLLLKAKLLQLAGQLNIQAITKFNGYLNKRQKIYFHNLVSPNYLIRA